ncbi:MAG: DUF423 domain-containing protein [Planctomycetota bacterium]|jgi:uncharacterized membrane protein YgdD (TMEM256/DUF423 family)
MNQLARVLIIIAALSGAISVAIGAMGAHSLPKRLEAQGFNQEQIDKKLHQCELATRYQMFHALGVLVLAATQYVTRSRLAMASAVLMLLGTVGFSGGLYSMVFADEIIHWSIVPIGGMLFILSWICLASSGLAKDRSDRSV